MFMIFTDHIFQRIILYHNYKYEYKHFHFQFLRRIYEFYKNFIKILNLTVVSQNN